MREAEETTDHHRDHCAAAGSAGWRAENGLRLDNIIFQLRGAQFAARPRAA